MAHTIDLLVPGELAGSRLDKAIAVLLGISRADAHRLCELGATVDGEPALPRTPVSEGSLIVTSVPAGPPELVPESVDFDVVLETPSLLAVDKPPGVVVHPGSGNVTGTLAAGLLHRYPEIEGVGTPGRWGLVHRLDRDTSGVLLVAKTEAAFRSLTAELADRRIGRTYTALVSGILSIPTGAIDAPIARDPARPTRRAVVPTGKPALTNYTVVATYPDDEVTLLDVELGTGRTHQIRVHLAAIEHPVIGDKTYRTRPTRVSSPRTFLHARAVSFTDPDSGERSTAESSLPSDLVAVLDTLGRPAFP